MRILHTSDWHLGRSLESINRIDEQIKFVDDLCDIAEQAKIDLVLIAGDVYDTYNPSAAAEELFYDAVDRLNERGKRAVIVIAGNHDNPERLCAASPLAWKHGIILLGYPASHAGAYIGRGDSIRVVDSAPGWLELGIRGCDHTAVVITLPYPSEARLEQLISKASDERELQRAYSDRIGEILAQLSGKYREDTVNLAVSHIFLKGGKETESERTLQVGGALTVDPSVLPAKAHFMALGHLHRPQPVKGAPCPAYYSGSPLAYSFSEADYSKVLYIVDALPGKETEIETVCIDSGRPLRRWTARNGIQEAVKWCEEGRDMGAWIDLEIYTDRVLTMEEQKALRSMNPGIINIRPIVRKEAVEAYTCINRENRKVDELFRDYYRYKTGTEISDELMGIFLDVVNQEQDAGMAIEDGEEA
ncbi:MAG: Exonuclease SbcD [Firmicutes bacterium]|nr:Exonuclease SbcD [Bacillota bacterium]